MAAQSPTRRLSCGIDYSSVPDIRKRLGEASEIGFDFVCISIVHPRLRREFISGKAKSRKGPFTRSDLVLVSSDWSSLIVGKINSYLDVDSKHEITRTLATEALEQELSYCSHLGLPAVMLPLNRPGAVNLARIINTRIQSACPYQIWIRLPMIPVSRFQSCYVDTGDNGASGDDDSGSSSPVKEDTWEWWNTFRSLCNFDKKLGLALVMTTDTPTPEEVDRWIGEPVKCIIIPTSLFVTNKKGYPVLLRVHQLLLQKFSHLDLQIVITGATWHNSLVYYYQYLEHIWQRFSCVDPLLSAFARGYEDYLQCPLQPLMDNLEAHTYEVFEKDPTKYNEYQRAIYHALLDRIPDNQKDSTCCIIMVLGAGRGPLVRASINAAFKADRVIKVYAVEKNQNAVVSLEAQQEEIWEDKVTVVSCDMREFNPPEKADIMVSELLGSFGDNELSPECLDGAQKFLKDDGISIPQKYTSYLAPIQSSKLYNEVRLCKEANKHPLHQFETPYVVHLQNRFQLDKPQDLFTFVHPNKDEVINNKRYKSLEFKAQQKSILHGFSGYFDTVLYSGPTSNITLSINPETYTKGMFSWFPIFFPLIEPMHINPGDTITVHFWRLCDKKNVWYEWSITSPKPIPIHNPKGRSYTIGL